MSKYLEETEIIDWRHPAIQKLAHELSGGNKTVMDIARDSFEWVRDNIMHSWDHQTGPVTCKASDVLQNKTGYCYAKSHLLAALLRANGIPAAFCYQRLVVDGKEQRCCLHGLNAVYLEDFGWYRIDARGNKEGVDAGFMPPVEKLAYVPLGSNEADLPGIFAEPLPLVVDVLTRSETIQEVYDDLPDIRPE